MVNGLSGVEGSIGIDRTAYSIDVSVLGETQIPRPIENVEDIIEISLEAYEAFRHLKVVSKGVCLHPSMFYTRLGMRADFKD